MDKDSGKAFDLRLFRRLMAHTRPYRLTFYGVALAAILLSVFSVIIPYLVQKIIDNAIMVPNAEMLLNLSVIMLGVLLAQVISQLLFNYYANWLGEMVIKDVRIDLFKHMLGFRMKYFDSSSLGVLVTRAVQDMQRIGEIFSQGFFMIVADLLKMLAAAAMMLYLNWKLALENAVEYYHVSTVHSRSVGAHVQEEPTFQPLGQHALQTLHITPYRWRGLPNGNERPVL